MKKILAFVLLILCIPCSVMAEDESPTTVNFSEIHLNPDAFMAAYGGRVSFDGYLDSWETDTVKVDGEYELVEIFKIYPGNSRDEEKITTLGFIIRDYWDHQTCKYDVMSLEEGDDVSVVGTVIGFDETNEGFIEIGNAVISGRDANADVSVVTKSSATDIPETELVLDTSAYTALENGDRGDGVKALQQRLIDLYYLNDKADGSFGKKTQAAVEKFQARNKLEVTGVADPMTQAVMFSEQAVENTLSVSCSSIVLGSSATTAWYVDGQEFTLKNKQTKTLKTVWGTYKFDAFGNYEKVE